MAFRKLLIDAQMNRRLIERTIEIASQSQEFGSRALRAALDSSPLWGAGRVEDTYNLVGHALKKIIHVVADQQGRELIEGGQEAGAEPPLSIAQQVTEQDVQVDEEGHASLIKSVAKDRRISVEDSEMRHGRKSRSVRVDGYKRHVPHDLHSDLIRAVGVTPANVPEASVTKAISEDLAHQAASMKELHIDRAYLSIRRGEKCRFLGVQKKKTGKLSLSYMAHHTFPSVISTSCSQTCQQRLLRSIAVRFPQTRRGQIRLRG